MNNNNYKNYSYNESENIDISSIGNEIFSNYLNKELGIKKPVWKKTKKLENNENSKSYISLQIKKQNQ